MKNNRIIQDAIDENCNADDATNKNYNRSINEHQYYKAKHEHISHLTIQTDLVNAFIEHFN